MLEVSGVTKHFGGLIAVDDVDFSINEGEIVGLIGPNGAGKTTLFNTITGIYKPDKGTIQFNGHNLIQMRPHEVCKLGVTRTFQIVRTFNESTVLDNVTIGVMFGSEEAMSVSEARERAKKHIEFVGLEGKEENLARNLTIADRKLVELARALASEPDLVLLDEIASGLNPSEISALSNTIKDIRADLNVSVFWIEHVMEAIMGTTDRIIVLNNGKKIAEGTPQEIRNNEQVSEAYLGEQNI